MLLMDRFPTADEIVQLPCLPLTPAPLPPGLAAATAAAAGAAGAAAGEAAAADGAATDQAAAAAQHTPVRQPHTAAAPESRHVEAATPVRH